MYSLLLQDLAGLRAAYVSQVNMAVGADREDIARELAQDYEADVIEAVTDWLDDESGRADPGKPSRKI